MKTLIVFALVITALTSPMSAQRPPVIQSAVYQWGLPGDMPIVGDVDGDGKPDLVIFRPSNGTWYIRTSSSFFLASYAVQWGLDGDVPMVGDYNGDSYLDLVVYRPSTGEWFILYGPIHP